MQTAFVLGWLCHTFAIACAEQVTCPFRVRAMHAHGPAARRPAHTL
jgi:hypothetical protein